ncbi:MAG: M28 family peptidase [Ignavibacteriales bacterium]|nr:M28 family peptidase [Ignavibacteriales bacterium]
MPVLVRLQDRRPPGAGDRACWPWPTGTDLDPACAGAAIRFTVLDRNTARRRDLLVVGTARPGDLDRPCARRAGPWPWSRGRRSSGPRRGIAAEAVPAGLPRKVLAPRSVLPSVAGRVRQRDPCGGQTAAQDPFVETIVALVTSSGANLAATRPDASRISRPATPRPRTATSAGESLYSAFSALGLDEVRFRAVHAIRRRPHVAQRRRREDRGDLTRTTSYIICAHYDSTSPSATRETLAPGADDNASGTAAVVEAARVLAPRPPRLHRPLHRLLGRGVGPLRAAGPTPPRPGRPASASAA